MKDSNEEVDFAPEEIIDPIEVICTGTCESLSGRSDLTFAIGRHTEDGTLHLAITGNSGGGMWCKRSGSVCLNSFTPRDKETAGGLN